MTAAELRQLLERTGISQYELARRLGVTQRSVVYWLDGRLITEQRERQILAAIAFRPRIFLTREDRLKVAELLDILATSIENAGEDPGRAGRLAAKYRDKIRASVGGHVASA